MMAMETPAVDRAGPEWWFSGRILGPLLLFAGAAVVAAGPWLVSIAALAVITVYMEPVMGRAAVEDLRLTVVYAFCLAPLTAGPIGTIASRMIGSGGAAPTGASASDIFAAAAAVAGAVTVALAVVLAAILDIGPPGLRIAFVFLCASAAQLWIVFAILAALKAHRFLIFAFLFAMGAAMVCVIVAADRIPTTEGLVWTFNAGILLCCALSGARIRRAGPARLEFRGAVRELCAGLARHRELAMGVLFAIATVWVDKWVLWFGPAGSRSAAGFYHYAPYDSVMFLAHITIVPLFAALILFHEGELSQAVAVFRQRLSDGSTRGVIRMGATDLAHRIWGGLSAILVFQAALTACFVLAGPMVTRVMDLGFDQILTLRTGLFAVFLHGIVFLAAMIVLLVNRVRLYLALMGGAMALNLLFSILFSAVSGATVGGFFVAMLAAAAVGFVVAYRSLLAFDYFAMLGENDGLYLHR